MALYIDNALTPERRIQVEETLARSSSAQTRLIARLREMNAFSEEAFQPGAVSTAESDPIPVSFRPRLISRPPSAAHEAPPHSPSARTARGGLCMGVGLGLFALSAVFAPAYPWAAAIACTGIVVGSWGAAITFGFSLRRPPATRFSRRAFAVAAGSSVAVSIVSIWAGFFLPRYLPYAQMLSLLAAFFALFCKALEHSSSPACLPHQSSSREEFRQEDTVRRQKGI
ncbi:MAG TPA: hypothetical protein PLO62_01065 [Candidatus Hydrogenedentes bacterium]|nr:hypothetical protein [Candidatus Hydrogenedentota bacterium]